MTIKRYFWKGKTGFILLLLVMGAAPRAGAAIADGTLITISRASNSDSTAGEYGNNDPTYGGSLHGGEFRITSAPEVFKTFCLEYNEFISLNGQYVATVEHGAILGGVSGGGAANGYYDPISGGTQWLYQAYRTSSLDELTGNVFDYDDSNWADALQLVFWRLEGEVNGNWKKSDDNSKLTGLSYQIGSSIISKADELWDFYSDNATWMDSYQNGAVLVLNLWDQSIDNSGNPFYNPANYARLEDPGEAAFRGSLAPYKAQSQLYFGGPSNAPPPIVPEPASLVIWGGFGLLGLAAAYRRRNRPVANA